jgi:hypothetical protein
MNWRPTPRSIHTSTLVVGTIGCADFVTYTLRKTNEWRTGMKPVSMIEQTDSMGK